MQTENKTEIEKRRVLRELLREFSELVEKAYVESPITESSRVDLMEKFYRDSYGLYVTVDLEEEYPTDFVKWKKYIEKHNITPQYITEKVFGPTDPHVQLALKKLDEIYIFLYPKK